MSPYMAIFICWALALSVAIYFDKQKQPEIFDSMLCSVHTPVAAILVNDELIMCSQKIYRRVK